MTHEHSLACVPLVPPTFSYLFCGALNNHKAQLPKELKIYVETLAFKHLGIEIVERRVDAVITAFMDRPVKMGWETKKTRLGRQLFGEGGRLGSIRIQEIVLMLVMGRLQ